MNKVKILWVDDSVDDFRDMFNALSEDLNNKENIFVEFVASDSYEDAKSKSFSEYDIIVTDYNLDDNKKAPELIEDINSGDFVGDLILYSQTTNFTVENSDYFLSYLGVKKTISQRKHVEENIHSFIIDYIRRHTDLYALRGYVISEFIEIEQKLNLILAKLIPSHDEELFSDTICNNKYISMFNKIAIIQHYINRHSNDDVIVIELKEIRKTLKDLSEDRNKFAHYIITEDKRLACGINSGPDLTELTAIKRKIKSCRSSLSLFLSKHFDNNQTT